MNPLLVDVPSTAHGHLRLRYAGTLYLRALPARPVGPPQGLNTTSAFIPATGFRKMSRVIGHVPLGEEALQGPSKATPIARTLASANS